MSVDILIYVPLLILCRIVLHLNKIAADVWQGLNVRIVFHKDKTFLHHI